MKSEWIMDIGEVWICRNCGEPCKEHFMGKPRWNYCPWCGADMLADRKTEPQTEYERASEQREHDILYEPTYDIDDGSM